MQGVEVPTQEVTEKEGPECGMSMRDSVGIAETEPAGIHLLPRARWVSDPFPSDSPMFYMAFLLQEALESCSHLLKVSRDITKCCCGSHLPTLSTTVQH